MKRFKYLLLVLVLIGALSTMFTGLTRAASPSCPSGSTGTPPNCCPPQSSDFFGLVPWYEYIKDQFSATTDSAGNSACVFNSNLETTTTDQNGNLQVTGVNGRALDSFWLIALAVFEDLLRVAGMVAVAMVIYGGARYMTSSGNPENTKAALQTIINALIGVAIAVIAAATVQFIGGQFGG